MHKTHNFSAILLNQYIYLCVNLNPHTKQWLFP